MHKIFQKLFRRGRSAAEKLRAKQLREAQVMELEHRLAADYHQAMANMHRDTQLRLTTYVRIDCTAADFEKVHTTLASHTHTMSRGGA